jgi:transposase InsO family protein
MACSARDGPEQREIQQGERMRQRLRVYASIRHADTAIRPPYSQGLSAGNITRFTRLLADAARFTHRSPGGRWFVDGTYLKVNMTWRYMYRAVDEYG